MRHYIIFIFTLLSLLSTSLMVRAAEAQFFETLYDVPIMPGLVEVPEQALSFDNPDGRISQAAAKANSIEDQAILSFYQSALSQMGWRMSKPAIFLREGEKLEISFEKSGTSSLVRFALGPE